MRLTDREREVVQLLAEGHLFKTVARELGVSESTVERHLENARDRNNAKTTTQVYPSLAPEAIALKVSNMTSHDAETILRVVNEELVETEGGSTD